MHTAGVEFDPVQAWARAAAAAGLPAEASTHLSLPASAAALSDWPAWVPGQVRADLARTGIAAPYAHQGDAANLAWSGTDVAISTGTASGKSLAYMLPVLSAIGSDRTAPATAIYLAPTKALARDQLRRWEAHRLPGLRLAAYDGDTPPQERRWARRHATVVVTNPDMVHAGILPNHDAWQSFLKRLRFVVVDEFHAYRGLFGAHLAAVLRRLLRVADHYGSCPVVVGASATVEDPAATLTTLTGRAAAAVSVGGAPRPGTDLFLVPPGERGVIASAAGLLAGLVGDGVPTLAFVRSRRAAEVLASAAGDILGAPGADGPIASYRSGYLPEERRDIEHRLRTGGLLGVAATSALELGIDITGLDAVLVAGWPGTRSALLQRIGRAGRTDRRALAVYLADSDPLEAHLVRHPQQLVGAAEGLVVDQANPTVLAPHLCATAAEVPINDSDAVRWFGPGAGRLLPLLGERGLLRRRAQGWFWTSDDRAVDLADLRGIGADPVAVVEPGTGRLVATVDRAAADRTVHAGAVYTHLGVDHLVLELDLEQGLARVERTALPYRTTAQSVADLRIIEVLSARRCGAARMCLGSVEVASRVVGFLKRRISTGEVLGHEPLDLPARVLRTKAVWWEVGDDLLLSAAIGDADVAGTVHAVEHAAIGMLPLFALCDRWDIGGLSTAAHPDTGGAAIFIHDGHPGGAGFAERGYTAAEPWLAATLRTVAECACQQGCPSCVQSPKCGSGNEPLDRAGAVRLLAALVADPEGGA
jgi:DEAD/DEAH box helicase domain-containing protein